MEVGNVRERNVMRVDYSHYACIENMSNWFKNPTLNLQAREVHGKDNDDIKV